MEIILLKEIEKVGHKHDVVTVKPGYARNFLIPQGLAKVANSSNMAELDAIKQKESELEEARLSEYRAMADKLEGKTLKIGAKAGTSGKIFGSVTNVQIAQALNEQFEIEVDRRKIEIGEEVKELGNYTANLKLHRDVEVDVNFEVIAE